MYVTHMPYLRANVPLFVRHMPDNSRYETNESTSSRVSTSTLSLSRKCTVRYLRTYIHCSIYIYSYEYMHMYMYK